MTRDEWIEEQVDRWAFGKSDTMSAMLRDAMRFADATACESLEKLLHPSCYAAISHGERCCFDTLCKQRNDALADAHPAETRAGGEVCGQNVLLPSSRVGCGQALEQAVIFRCMECAVPFHRECLRKHCGISHPAPPALDTHSANDLARSHQVEALEPDRETKRKEDGMDTFGNCGHCGEALPNPTSAAHQCAAPPLATRDWMDDEIDKLETAFLDGCWLDFKPKLKALLLKRPTDSAPEQGHE